VVIGARERWGNKNMTRVFIGMKKIGIKSICFITLVLRISCTIDATRVEILRHDEK
jgi:hypothetical protein